MNQTATAPTENKAPPISRSEKIFDWLVYGGIAGVGTFIATIPTTYWAKYGGGAKYFDASSKWLVKKGLSEQSAEQAVMTSALMQGGNLALIPVKWAEDNKVALVKKFGDVIGEKVDTVALEAEDKQTWGSIIKARIVAWGVVFASLKGAAHVLGEDKFAAFENKFSKHIVCEPLGKPTHLHGQETKAFRLGKIGALDVFATAAASTLLFLGSRFFAHLERQKEDAKHIAETPITPPQVHEAAASEPSSKAATEILKSKAPAQDFATAAIASRTGEQLQLGA